MQSNNVRVVQLFHYLKLRDFVIRCGFGCFDFGFLNNFHRKAFSFGDVLALNDCRLISDSELRLAEQILIDHLPIV